MHFWSTYEGQPFYKNRGYCKCASECESESSAPEDWLPHLVAHHPKLCALRRAVRAQPPTGSVAYWLQQVPRKGARNGLTQHSQPGCPTTWLSTQRAFFFDLLRPNKQKWDLLAAKRAEKGCPKRPLPAPEIRLPNHVIQRPEFCAFHKAHFWLTFGRPTLYKNGRYWLLKVPEKSALGDAFEDQLPTK